jgi:hypothetical protein
MLKTWLLVKITLVFALAAVIICCLIWLVQRDPHPDPAALPTIYFFIMPLILGNLLLLSWCQVYNFKHRGGEGGRGRN